MSSYLVWEFLLWWLDIFILGYDVNGNSYLGMFGVMVGVFYFYFLEIFSYMLLFGFYEFVYYLSSYYYVNGWFGFYLDMYLCVE